MWPTLLLSGLLLVKLGEPYPSRQSLFIYLSKGQKVMVPLLSPFSFYANSFSHKKKKKLLEQDMMALKDFYKGSAEICNREKR